LDTGRRGKKRVDFECFFGHREERRGETSVPQRSRKRNKRRTHPFTIFQFIKTFRWRGEREGTSRAILEKNKEEVRGAKGSEKEKSPPAKEDRPAGKRGDAPIP